MNFYKNVHYRLKMSFKWHILTWTLIKLYELNLQQNAVWVINANKKGERKIIYKHKPMTWLWIIQSKEISTG